MIHRDEGIIGAVSMIRLTEIDDRTQCDQMAVFFSIFGHWEQWKFAQKYKIFAKVGSQFCQILNSCSRNGQNFLKFWLSGKILPHLFTLIGHESVNFGMSICDDIVISVTRLGDFWKFRVKNILTKVANCLASFGHF